MSIARIKKNDTVIAVTGEYAGQTGEVLEIDRTTGRAIVKGLNLVTKAKRSTGQGAVSGHNTVEAPIQMSNLMPYDAEAKRGVRIRREREGERSVRKARKTGRSLD